MLFQHLDCPSRHLTTRLLCTLSQLGLFRKKVTCSVFTLTVSHSQLGLPEAVMRTDPASSDFKRRWKHVGVLQHVAARRRSHTDSGLPATSIAFTWASLSALANVTTMYSDMLFTEARFCTSFWLQGLHLSTLSDKLLVFWKLMIASDLVDVCWAVQKNIFIFCIEKKARNTLSKRF